jgi:hypothetical protein
MALHGMEQKPVPYREKVKSRKSFQVFKNGSFWLLFRLTNCFTWLCSQWRPRRRGRRLEQEVSGIAFDENDTGWGGSLSVLQDL